MLLAGLAFAASCPTGPGGLSWAEDRPPGLKSEIQIRPGFQNPWRYPLVEIYLSNQTGKAVQWTGVTMDGVALGNGTNCVWTQYYPNEKAGPGRTTLLQICLEDAPQVARKIEVETSDGQKVPVNLDPFPAKPRTDQSKDFFGGMPKNAILLDDYSTQAFPIPKCRLLGVTFDSAFKHIQVSWSSSTKGISCKRMVINGDMIPGTKESLFSSDDLPKFAGSAGMVCAAVAKPVQFGELIHVHIELSDNTTAQCLMRATNDFFVDDLGISRTVEGEASRKDLGLDLHPKWKDLGFDVACADFATQKWGQSAPQLVAARKAAYDGGDPQPTYQYLCVSSIQNTYSIYGQCSDGLQVNPYRRGWSTWEKFIEEEAQTFRWAREAAQPRPWFWIPEVFIHKDDKRFLEADEYRSLTYAALGHACKGIGLYVYDDKTVVGYSKNPSLLAEIKKVNAEIARLRPMLEPAQFISRKTIGDPDTGVRQYVLWSGQDGVLVILRNTDYSTDRKPDDMGRAPRFKCNSKSDVTAAVHIPSWIKESLAGGSNPLQVLDPLSGEVLPHKQDGDLVSVSLPKLDIGRILWIPTPKGNAGK